MNFIQALIFLHCMSLILSQKYFREWENSEMTMKRLVQLMMNYANQAKVSVDDMNKYRVNYEVSPHFEMGYVMSELLDRYRKLVEQARHPLDYNSDTVFDTLKTAELVQKLFFEIYHIVNMLHEIPRKYGHMKEFQKEGDGFDISEAIDAQERLKILEKERERRRKELMKEMKQNKELFELQEKGGTRKPRKPGNKWWPIDYGWEIDYYWR